MRPRKAQLPTLSPRIATMDLRTARPPDRSEKRAEPFYSSPAYRTWRAAIIARAGGCCQAPGCGKSAGRLFADHIVEIRDDPSRALDISNGQALCPRHHTLKTHASRLKRLAT